MTRVIPFRHNKSTEGMGKKRAIQKSEPEIEQAVPESDSTEPNKTPERKSIVLPAYIWRVIEKEAEDQLRTLSRQIEAVMINYYQLGTHKIESIDKMTPGNYGFVSQKVFKAS